MTKQMTTITITPSTITIIMILIIIMIIYWMMIKIAINNVDVVMIVWPIKQNYIKQ